MTFGVGLTFRLKVATTSRWAGHICSLYGGCVVTLRGFMRDSESAPGTAGGSEQDLWFPIVTVTTSRVIFQEAALPPCAYQESGGLRFGFYHGQSSRCTVTKFCEKDCRFMI